MGKIKEYDDPYQVLSCCLIAYLRRADVERILHDNEYIENLIRKEARQIDLAGWFTDAIVVDIMEEKRRMDLMRELDKLGHYLYTELDKDRLRKNIKANYKKYFKIDLQ